MLGRSVGLFTCALGARALLIPPGFEPTTSVNDAPLAVGVLGSLPTSQLIQLPCPSCAFGNTDERIQEEQNDDVVYIQGGAKDIILNLTVSEDGKAIEMNGRVIYPRRKAKHHSWTVDQVPGSASLEDIKAGTVNAVPLTITGYGVNLHKHITPQLDTIIEMEFEIYSLDYQRMDLSKVDFRFIELSGDHAGQMILLSGTALGAGAFDDPELVPATEYAPPPGSHRGHFHGRPADVDACGMLPSPICRLKHMMEDKLSGMRHGGHGRPGCSGRKGGPHHLPGHIKGPKFNIVEGDEMFREDERHGPPHHMGGWKHHGHKHSFLHSFVKGFVAITIPIMAGVAVGMTVSLLGMLAGRLIAIVCEKISGARSRRYVSVAQEDVEECSEQGPAEMEAPPAYENAPTYEPVEKE